jgi:hypothetical protein
VLLMVWVMVGCVSEPTVEERHRAGSMAANIWKCSTDESAMIEGPTAYWPNCEALYADACTTPEGWRLLFAAGALGNAPCADSDEMMCLAAGEGCPE